MDDGDSSLVSVIGVYMPCSDQGLECYRDHLIELERVISESSLLGPVIILGDFNAHLGSLGGKKGQDDPNVQGVLVSEVMEQCNLSAVSVASLSSDPSFTYMSGDVRTTVDYILADVEATSLMSGCRILSMDDLNTSDHLPLFVNMVYASCQEDHMEGAVSQSIDLDQAR